MPDNARSSSSSSVLSGFIKWAGGIAAAVLAAVLIHYFTLPPSPPTQFAFYGMVTDAASHALISNARVVVSVGANSVSQATDPLGKYNVVLTSAGSGAVMADIKISASGYQEYDNSVALTPGTNFTDFPLQSVHAPAAPPAVAAPAPGAGPIQVAVHAAPIVFRKPPPDFKRPAAVLMKLHH